MFANRGARVLAPAYLGRARCRSHTSGPRKGGPEAATSIEQTGWDPHMLRLTGTVVRVERKTGQSSSGNHWAMDVVRVLVAGQSIVEFNAFAEKDPAHPSGFAAPAYQLGAEIDYAVNVKAGRYGVEVAADMPWAKLEPAVAPLAVAGSTSKAS